MTRACLLSVAALLIGAAHAPAAAQNREPASAKAPAPTSTSDTGVKPVGSVGAPSASAAPRLTVTAAPRLGSPIATAWPSLRHRPRIVAVPGLRPVVVPLGAKSHDGYDERIKRCVHYGMAAGVPINEIARFTVQCLQ